MILSCEEEFQDKETPNRSFIIRTDGTTNPYDFFRLCGKLPILEQPHPDKDKWPNFVCTETASVMIENGFWRVSASYNRKIELPEENDEPQFPPYDGHKGRQSDGSFILTPRCYREMQRLFQSQHSRFVLPSNQPKETIERFFKIIYEDTGWDMEVLC